MRDQYRLYHHAIETHLVMIFHACLAHMRQEVALERISNAFSAIRQSGSQELLPDSVTIEDLRDLISYLFARY